MRAGNPRPGRVDHRHGGRLKVWRVRAAVGVHRRRARHRVRPRARRHRRRRARAGRGAARRQSRAWTRNAWLRRSPRARPARSVRDSRREQRTDDRTCHRARRRARRAGAHRRRRVRARRAARRCCAQTSLSDRDRAFATDLVYGTVRCATPPRRPARPRAEAPDPPTRPAGARRAAPRRVPARCTTCRRTRRWRDGRRVGARSPRARASSTRRCAALTRLAAAVARAATDDAVRALVPRLDRRAARRATSAATTRRDALGRHERAGRGHAAPEPAPGDGRPRSRASSQRPASTSRPGRLVTDALLVRGIGDLGALAAVRDGRATPQDQASQAVVAVLGSAAGGAHRRSRRRAGRQGHGHRRARRAPTARSSRSTSTPGACASIDSAAPPHRAAAPRSRSSPTAARRPAAPPARSTGCCSTRPCSGLGVLRRRPDARWRLQPRRDRRARGAATRPARRRRAAVRPGGVLVYSVCTLTNEETLGVDDVGRPSTARVHAAAAARARPWRRARRGALLLPQAAGTDGMFVLASVRGGERVAAELSDRGSHRVSP